MRKYNIVDFNGVNVGKVVEVRQLGQCQAWALIEDAGRILFQSYNTICGYIENNVFYEFGKYSRTTSKQRAKFLKEYLCGHNIVELGHQQETYFSY